MPERDDIGAWDLKFFGNWNLELGTSECVNVVSYAFSIFHTLNASVTLQD
jgi:hypothetical protein